MVVKSVSDLIKVEVFSNGEILCLKAVSISDFINTSKFKIKGKFTTIIFFNVRFT